MEIVDQDLGEINKEQVERVIKVALLCTNASPMVRPTMSDVIDMLKEQTTVQEVVSDPGIYGDVLTNDVRFNSLKAYYQQTQNKNALDTQGSDFNLNKPAASTSANDLYPMNPESLTISGHDLYQINLQSANNSDFFSDVKDSSSMLR